MWYGGGEGGLPKRILVSRFEQCAIYCAAPPASPPPLLLLLLLLPLFHVRIGTAAAAAPIHPIHPIHSIHPLPPTPPPPGHLRPIFELPNRVGTIDVRKLAAWPTAKEFEELYAPPFESARSSTNCSATIKRLCGDLKRCDRACQLSCIQKHNDVLQGACFAVAWGKPVLFRGAAKAMPAFRNFATDERMVEHYGGAFLDGIEMNDKKESRVHEQDQCTVRDFVERYNKEPMYAVSSVPWELAGDLEVLPFLECRGPLRRLDIANMWWSNGGTKSVIHNDGQDNMNCLFAGRKRMIFWSPNYEETIEQEECGWVVADEHAVGGNKKGYGSYGGELDVDAMDLVKYVSHTIHMYIQRITTHV